MTIHEEVFIPQQTSEQAVAAEMTESADKPYTLFPMEVFNDMVDALRRGTTVELDQTTDPVAHEAIERVKGVNEILEAMQDEYDIVENVLKDQGFKGKELEAELEAYREERMFASPINGMPWHNQRGTAIALHTIQEANDNMGTMSGTVGHEVFNQRIDGLTLQEALEHVLIADGKTPEQAKNKAVKRLSNLQEFIDAPTTQPFLEVVKYCADSLGIRARGRIVVQEAASHVLEMQEQGTMPDRPRLVSIGCGNGRPVFETALALIEQGVSPRIELIDQDPVALAYAKQLADNMGLSEYVTIHCKSILENWKPISITELLDVQDEQDAPVVIEDSGLREYLPNSMNLDLNKEVLASLHPEGISISGNMNDKRPNKNYLHGLMGWRPRVQMRNIQQMTEIYEKAGVPGDKLRVVVTGEGVYSVYVVKKSDLEIDE